MNTPPIEIHDLTVSYDQKPVLWNIDAVSYTHLTLPTILLV